MMEKGRCNLQHKNARLQQVIDAIQPLDEAVMAAAKKRQDALAKPPGSLGRLEDLSIQLAGITGKVHNSVDKRRIVILCADNGVVAEGVASAPQSVTLAQTINFTRGLTGVAALARQFGDELMVVDVGINARLEHPGVINRKIAMGTKNLALEPAMTYDQALEGLFIGVALSEQCAAEGVSILGIGEMGIGNTTTSAAVLSALTGLPVEETVGKGGGITEDSFQRKKEIISHALLRYRPDPSDPVDVLAKVGGFDLCAMTGVFLGAAVQRIPVVVDGYISIVAALAAKRLCKTAASYMILSHASYELGYEQAARQLGLEPMLLLHMRLGEGSGCPLAFQVVSAACGAMNRMGTFAEAAIDDSYLEEIRKGDHFTVQRRDRI